MPGIYIRCLLLLSFLFLNLKSVHPYFMCMYAQKHGTAHTCKSENNLWVLAFSSGHMGPRDQTQVIRLGGEGLYPLSHSRHTHTPPTSLGLFFEDLFIFILCVCVFHLHVYMYVCIYECIPNTCMTPAELEEDIGFLATRITHGCKPLCEH